MLGQYLFWTYIFLSVRIEGFFDNLSNGKFWVRGTDSTTLG